AEGTPGALKAEIGRPSIHATPLAEDDARRVEAVLTRFGEPVVGATRDIAVRLRDGTAGLADVVRALDGEGLVVANLELEQPTLDDVFLAKTGRSLEGAGDEDEPAQPVGGRR